MKLTPGRGIRTLSVVVKGFQKRLRRQSDKPLILRPSIAGLCAFTLCKMANCPSRECLLHRDVQRFSDATLCAHIAVMGTTAGLMASESGLSISRTKRGYLKQGIGFHVRSDSMRAALADAGPQDYVERKIDNGTSFRVTVDGTSYSIAVKTHYVGDFAEITVCPSTDVKYDKLTGPSFRINLVAIPFLA